MEYPFLMNKRNFLHVPNTPETMKAVGDNFVPITLEQALALDRDRAAEGLRIMRAVVAADNAAALREAEARIASMAKSAAPATIPAPATAPYAAEPEKVGAEPVGGGDKAPEDMTYDELKAAAVAKGFVLPKGNPSKKSLIDFLNGGAATADGAAPAEEA